MTRKEKLQEILARFLDETRYTMDEIDELPFENKKTEAATKLLADFEEKLDEFMETQLA